MANGAVAQMAEQRAVSARRWMFDSSPLHSNLFRNRNVALVKKRLNPPPQFWTEAAFNMLNAARIVFHVIEDSYCVRSGVERRVFHKENS